MSDKQDVLSIYVMSALKLQNLALDECRQHAVIVQFSLIEKMAETFLHEKIPESVEPATIYKL